MAEYNDDEPGGFRVLGGGSRVTSRFSGVDKLGPGFKEAVAQAPLSPVNAGPRKGGTNLNRAEAAMNNVLDLLKETKGQGGVAVTLAKGQAIKPNPRMEGLDRYQIQNAVSELYDAARERDVGLLKRIHPLAANLKDTPYVTENCVGPLFSRMSTLEGATALESILKSEAGTRPGIESTAAKMLTRLECAHETAWQRRFGCDDDRSQAMYGHRTRPIQAQEYVTAAPIDPQSLPLGHRDRPKGVYTAPLEPMPIPSLQPPPAGTRQVIDVAELERRGGSSHSKSVWPKTEMGLPNLSQILRDADRTKKAGGHVQTGQEQPLVSDNDLPIGKGFLP